MLLSFGGTLIVPTFAADAPELFNNSTLSVDAAYGGARFAHPATINAHNAAGASPAVPVLTSCPPSRSRIGIPTLFSGSLDCAARSRQSDRGDLAAPPGAESQAKRKRNWLGSRCAADQGTVTGKVGTGRVLRGLSGFGWIDWKRSGGCKRRLAGGTRGPAHYCMPRGQAVGRSPSDSEQPARLRAAIIAAASAEGDAHSGVSRPLVLGRDVG